MILSLLHELYCCDSDIKREPRRQKKEEWDYKILHYIHKHSKNHSLTRKYDNVQHRYELETRWKKITTRKRRQMILCDFVLKKEDRSTCAANYKCPPRRRVIPEPHTATHDHRRKSLSFLNLSLRLFHALCKNSSSRRVNLRDYKSTTIKCPAIKPSTSSHRRVRLESYL